MKVIPVEAYLLLFSIMQKQAASTQGRVFEILE